MARKRPAKARASRRRAARPRHHEHASQHTFEKGMENFGKEMGDLGERLGKRLEERRERRESWWYRTFGLAGPFISSVFALAILALGILAINFVNLPIGSGFLLNIASFLTVNIGLFFLLFLFFSYASYFSRHYPLGYRPFMPLAIAVSITAAFWIVMNAISIANISLGYETLAAISLWTARLLPIIFGLSVFIGYIVLVVRISMEKPEERAILARQHLDGRRQESPSGQKGSREPEVRRLYRSGKDRILGGVCGGLGEYFGIDPVIIRLIFVILAFGWGFGILLYIIAWIIIPRNPEHKWNR